MPNIGVQRENTADIQASIQDFAKSVAADPGPTIPMAATHVMVIASPASADLDLYTH